MDTNVDHTTRTVTPTRAQPVRDQILAYPTEPRHAYGIAAHTGWRTATITGHMRAMLRLGLLERVAYGVYARADTLRGPAPAGVLTRLTRTATYRSSSVDNSNGTGGSLPPCPV